MEVTYKYVLESKPITKSKDQFLQSFFDEHFQEFLDKKIMIMISPKLGPSDTLFQLDLDSKLNETNRPDFEAQRVFKNLNIAFKPYKFNMEITPNGCHIVSNFVYTRIHEDMVKTKEALKSHLTRIRNLDLDASFNSIPFKRIGYDPSRNFIYIPTNKPSVKLRNNIMMNKIKISEVFWELYIKENLLGGNSKMSMIELSKRLEKFDDIMQGD